MSMNIDERCNPRTCFCPEICRWVLTLTEEQQMWFRLMIDLNWFEPEGSFN